MQILKLDELANGAVAEKFNVEMEKVLRNLMDLNTDFKKARKITLTCNFSTTEDRDEAVVDFEIKSALAPQKGVMSRMIIGKDAEGKVQAAECEKGQLPGQTKFDEETGEVIDGVIDFRKSARV